MNEREPTPDELLAMAYADGELGPAERARFEARLAGEPALARAVASHQRLNVLARAVAPSEPQDHEWARIRRGGMHRLGLPLASFLVLAGAGLALGAGLVAVWSSGAPLLLKIALGLLCAGFGLWLALVARARARTRPYDPYTEVER